MSSVVIFLKNIVFNLFYPPLYLYIYLPILAPSGMGIISDSPRNHVGRPIFFLGTPIGRFWVCGIIWRVPFSSALASERSLTRHGDINTSTSLSCRELSQFSEQDIFCSVRYPVPGTFLKEELPALLERYQV